MKHLTLVFAMMLVCISMAFAQRTISGTVTDESGEVLPFANVFVEGTTVGTTTDIDGNYTLKVPEGATTIVVAYTGYSDMKLGLGDSNSLDFTMAEGVVLDDIVVTALGIERAEKALGYAVEEVDAEQLKRSGQNNIVDAIQGISGAQITSSGGEPGAGSSIVLRGYSSISFNNQPLMVVDGVPIDNSAVSSSEEGNANYGSSTRSTNRAIDLNPDEIESISVLKGGAAAALYGSRAANGALIITTKKGGKNKGLNIEYNYGHSWDQVNKLPEITHKYARGRGGDYSNVTHWSWGPAYESNPTFPTDGDGTIADIDGDGTLEDVSGMAIPLYEGNFERFWQDGYSNKHNVSISGGGEKNTFYTSFGRFDQQGIIPNSDFNRTNVSIRGTQDIGDRLTVSGSATYTNTGGTKFQAANGIMYGMGYWHHMWDVNGYPWADDNSNKTWFSNGVPHPQWIVNEEGEDYTVNRIIGNTGFNYKFINSDDFKLGLSYKIGLDQYSDGRKQVRPRGSVQTAGDAGDITEIRINSQDLNSDLILRGQKYFGDFDLSVLVGNNIYRNKTNRLYNRGDELVLTGFEDISNSVGQTVVNDTGGKMLLGAYGDVTLGYKSIIYLGLTGRNDWSSTLPLDNNSYFYPSANASFVFSELVNQNWLSYGKIRASYAEVANDAPIQSLKTVFQKFEPNVADNPRFTLSDTRNNPTLRPERTKEYEFGIDVRLFEDRFGFDVAYYDKTSVDQILYVPISSTSGYDEYIANLGEVSNKGIEAGAYIRNPVKLDGLDWTLGANFTRNVGEIVKISEDLDRVILANGWWTNSQLAAIEGEQFGTLYGYQYETNDDGRILIDDNGYPIPQAERSIVGNINPDWVMRINNSFDFKGINLGFLLEYKKGGDLVNGTLANLIYSGLSEVTSDRYYSASDPYANATHVFDGVRDNGDGTYTENTIAAPLTNTYFHNNFINTDQNLIEDTTWWRLRNVSIGYSIPSALLENTGFIRGLDISLTGRNLWLKTNYRGIDPETSALGPGNLQGFDELQMPNTKSYSVNLTARF